MTPGPARLRLLVHALDRTGPPMLARAVGRWFRRERPDVDLDVVAFRGGPMEADMAALGPVEVVLRDEEPWDVRAPDPDRVAAIAGRLAALPPAGANLLVSVAAAQVLPMLPAASGPVVTWVVEVGEDLHWLDAPLGLRERTARWLAGSAASAAELAPRLGDRVSVVPEMVEPPRPVSEAEVAALRRAHDVADDDLLVLGAGIGTFRKGMDLFLEVACAHRSRSHHPASFVWVGGARDPLYPRVRADVRRLRLPHVRVLPPVPDLDPWCAAADVFLHPARRDAFPLVCLHAAAAGTPVVSFAGTGGVDEMFGPTGLGVPYPDVDGLRRAVDRLADPVVRRRAGAAQATWVGARYTSPAAGPALAHALDAVARW